MTGLTDEGGRTAETVQADLQAAKTPATASTASGLAALGSPEGKETAVTNDSNRGIKPDAVHEGSAPIGAQREAAFFTPGGSIPGGSIPSPSGPVPASVIGDDAAREAAIKAARAGAVQTNGRFRISDEAARRMSPAELRAVAHDRGYQGIEGGRRSVQTKFLAEQKKDDSLETPPEGHHLGVEAQAQAPVNPAPTTGNPLATPSRPGGLETPVGTLRGTDGKTPPPTSAPSPTKKP